jgi:hypothetical protein
MDVLPFMTDLMNKHKSGGSNLEESSFENGEN